MSDVEGHDLERGVLYESALHAVTRTRHVLLVLTAIAGLGYFLLYQWYGSWEHARIAGRRDVSAFLLASSKAGGTPYFESSATDSAMARQFSDEADSLRQRLSGRELSLPAFGVTVPFADYSVALLMAALGALLWLLFYQRRLLACLSRLDRVEGWGLASTLLEFQLGLVGERGGWATRRAARILVWALGILGLLYLASDLFDLHEIKEGPVGDLAFRGFEFRLRVAIRLLVDLALASAVSYVGFRVLRSQQRAERELLRYAGTEPR